MIDVWKVHGFSLTTTLGAAYIFCAIFDALFPPFGLIAALAPVSPWPISGSPLALLTGCASFIVAGLCSAHSMESHGNSGSMRTILSHILFATGDPQDFDQRMKCPVAGLRPLANAASALVQARSGDIILAFAD